MAAKDKMYLSSVYEFEEFKIWCLIHKPNLLLNFYNPFMSRTEWEDNQKEIHQNHKDYAIRDYNRYECDKGMNRALELYVTNIKNLYGIESVPTDLYDRYLMYMDQTLPDISLTTAVIELGHILDNYYKVTSKSYDEKYVDEELAIANFSDKQNKYLLWHCPIDCVRDYLEKHGYHTKWYHNFFWYGNK